MRTLVPEGSRSSTYARIDVRIDDNSGQSPTLPSRRPASDPSCSQSTTSLGSETRDSERTFLEGLESLVVQFGGSMEAMFDGMARLLPAGCRDPERYAAAVISGGRVHASPGWRDSPRRLARDILAHEQPVGSVQLVRLEEHPDQPWDGFGAQEKQLVGFAAALLGKTVERLEASERLRGTVVQLQQERAALERANAALRGILDRIDDERREVGRSVVANVERLVMPLIAAIEERIPPPDRPIAEFLKRSLEEITSPFVEQLSRNFASLTPLEVAICRMLRDGLSSKEVAKIRQVSHSTIARQREHIRRKLGLAGTQTNLATFLRINLADNGENHADVRRGRTKTSSAAPCRGY